MCVTQDAAASGKVRAGILHFGKRMTGGMGRTSGCSGLLGCCTEALCKQGSTETGDSKLVRKVIFRGAEVIHKLAPIL